MSDNEHLADLGDQFEVMVNAPGVLWTTISVDDLLPQHQDVVAILGGLAWLAGPRIGNNMVIKVNDEVIQYVDLFEDGRYMFCTNDHHNGLHPRDVAKRLDVLTASNPEELAVRHQAADRMWPKDRDHEKLLRPNKDPRLDS